MLLMGGGGGGVCITLIGDEYGSDDYGNDIEIDNEDKEIWVSSTCTNVISHWVEQNRSTGMPWKYPGCYANTVYIPT